MGELSAAGGEACVSWIQPATLRPSLYSVSF